jgi:hypothetical protein
MLYEVIYLTFHDNVLQRRCINYVHFTSNYANTFMKKLISNKIIINSLTPCSTVLEKLTVPQLVKKFLAFYGTRGFITTFTTACHLSLS